MFDVIYNLLKSVWNFIKKIWKQIVNFFKDIADFFKAKWRAWKIKRNKNIIGVTIKKKLKEKDYTVINCIFDTDKNELVDYERDSEIINTNQIDTQTEEMFKGKEMIVING